MSSHARARTPGEDRGTHLVPRVPMQARGTRTVDALHRAAERLLRNREFHGVSVADLAKAAGIGVGTFYHFFPSKDALLLDVRDAVYARSLEQLGKRLSAPLLDGKHVRATLEQLILGWIEIARERQGLERAIAARASADAAFASALRAQERAIEARVVESLEGFTEEFRSIDIPATARLFVIIVDAVVVRAMRESDIAENPAPLVHELARMMVRHLLPPSGRGRKAT